MGGGSSKAKKTTVLPPKPVAGPDGKPPLEVAPETVPAAKSVSAPALIPQLRSLACWILWQKECSPHMTMKFHPHYKKWLTLSEIMIMRVFKQITIGCGLI